MSRRGPIYAIASAPAPGAVRFEVALRLDSPNKTRGAHWTVKHRSTKLWEHALGEALGTRHWKALVLRDTERERRRVTVALLYPSRRNFIKDADNLAFSVKPLNDALTRLRLLSDDSHAWLGQDVPTQGVSPDGRFWTVITIERDLTITPIISHEDPAKPSISAVSR